MIENRSTRPPIETADPVELSTTTIDDGSTHELTNRLTQSLTEVDDNIAIVESFSHVIAFRTEDGLVCFDSSGVFTGEKVTEALRGWSTDRVNTLVYTHGHVDHVGGSGALAADAETRGHALPTVVAHTHVQDRLDRYRETNGWNLAINARQFGNVNNAALGIGAEQQFLPPETLEPTHAYDTDDSLSVGGLDIELFHDLGETDDHTWAWIPEHKALCVGDFVTWVFPNCGNPQKVQRYPKEWAAALRKMMAYDAEWLFGAHGLPVRGADRVRIVLNDLATALEFLVTETLSLMNQGAALNDILHAVALPDDLLWKPWMMPVYDEPEFVIRNIWRRYGGWWDQNPANLKPASDAALGAEVSALAGGATALAARAVELAEAGEHRLAGHLIEMAAAAAPDDPGVHEARVTVWTARRSTELSLMSQGIYTSAINESKDKLTS